MRPEEVLDWVRAVPFVPFRIRLLTGRSFDIRHPEMLSVGRDKMQVYTFAGDPTEPHERMEMISLSLIKTVEPVG